MNTFTCEFCKISFQRSGSHQYRFCSRACRQRIKANPEKKKEFTCKLCGKPFIDWVYRNPTYCSLSCRGKVGGKREKPHFRVEGFRIEKQCLICGKPFTTNRIQIALRTGGGKYCSNKCQHEGQGISIRGANHHHWKGGGIGYRGENWEYQSKKARKRDGHMCRICGIPYQRGVTILDVHHIKPFREFDGDYESANHLNNLITLCQPCHRKVEYGHLALPV